MIKLAQPGPGSAVSPAPHRSGDSKAVAVIADETLRLEFDSAMRPRAWHLRPDAPHSRLALRDWSETDYLVLADGAPLIDVPMYQADAVVRRAPSLQRTREGRTAAGQY